MIKNRNGSNFYLDISRAEFIPKVVMDAVHAQVPRAVAMMPTQDVLDLSISGAHKVRDMSQYTDQQLVATEATVQDQAATITALKIQLASELEQSQKDRDEFRAVLAKK